MPLPAPPAAHDPADRHAAGHLHDQPHDHPHDHRLADLPDQSLDHADHGAALPSPLWWSASLRLACATLLSASLWLVIAWAMA